ncbi:MAG: hypothetical protein AAF351_05990 [Pseudomonadota bacterium]
MKIRTSFAVLVLAWSQFALAERELVTLVEATELSPSNIILPASVNGMMTFQPCANECDEKYERARLTAATQFTVNGSKVKFEDFQKAFAVLKRAESAYALVSVDVKESTVSSIEIAD